MPRAGIFASARHAAASSGPTFQQSAVDPANSSTYTFTSQPIGTAAANRRVIVGVVGRDGTSVSAVTIGGVSATLDATAAGTNIAALASAVVPTGTTASVVVTFTGTATRCGIGVWTQNGVAPTGNTAADTTNPFGLTVTTSAGQTVVACLMWVGTAGAAAWTGATERYDQTVEGTIQHSGGDKIATGASTTIDVTTGSGGSAVAAAYA